MDTSPGAATAPLGWTVTAGERDFEAFYTAHFDDLLAELCTHTNNRATARAVVQQAFARALAHWSRLSRADDPGAWIRRVAVSLATSRWHRWPTGDDTNGQDLDGVRTIARHRRRAHTVVLGAVAAVLLAAPLGGYAATVRHESAPVPPVPAQSPSPTPSQTTSPTPGPSSPAPVVAAAPDGRFTIAQLSHMTVYLPAWTNTAMPSCPSGRFTFTGNPTRVSDPNYVDGYVFVDVSKVAYADVDRDGAPETAAVINCYLQGGDQQVVAFDRNAGGGIVTIGTVISSGGSAAAVQQVFDVRPAANGTDVEAQVGDDHPCCGVMPEDVEHQWRGYRWNGHSFYQVTGPTKFTRPVVQLNDLTVRSTAVTLGAVSDGVRTGTATVTVTNKGPADVVGWRATVHLYAYPTTSPHAVLMAGPAGSVYTPPDNYWTTLAYGGPALARGASSTFTVTFTASRDYDVIIPVAGTSPGFRCSVEVEEETNTQVAPDLNPSDNLTTIPITRLA